MQHECVHVCARVQRGDTKQCVCVTTYAAPPSPLHPPHTCQMSCSTAQRKWSKTDSTFWTSPLRASPASRACDGGGPNLEKRFHSNEANARHIRWHGARGRQRESVERRYRAVCAQDACLSSVWVHVCTCVRACVLVRAASVEKKRLSPSSIHCRRTFDVAVAAAGRKWSKIGF